MASFKKFQIFISSTYEDLKDERNEVFHTIYAMHHIPAGMEYFNAADETSWNIIKGVIDESDFYVIILGHRYGSMDSEGIGYTEKEYNYANSKKIPILSFVRDRNHPVSPQFIDTGNSKDKLEKFIDKIKERQCSFWTTKEDLCNKISVSFFQAIENHDRPGWVRGMGDLVRLTDNIKNQRAAELADIATDKQISYALIENNIRNLKEILKQSVYKNSDIPVKNLDNIIKKFDEDDYADLDKDKLKPLLGTVMVHSSLGDYLTKKPAFKSFMEEYASFTDNLKITLGLLKYKDNLLAQKIVMGISIQPVIIRWGTDLTSILNSNMKDHFIESLDKESYKNIKRKESFNLMHPIIRFYELMHHVIQYITVLENDLKTSTS